VSASGLVLALFGVVVIAQVTMGDALGRLGMPGFS
jgi:hypothetical protein